MHVEMVQQLLESIYQIYQRTNDVEVHRHKKTHLRSHMHVHVHGYSTVNLVKPFR